MVDVVVVWYGTGDTVRIQRCDVTVNISSSFAISWTFSVFFASVLRGFLRQHTNDYAVTNMSSPSGTLTQDDIVSLSHQQTSTTMF